MSKYAIRFGHQATGGDTAAEGIIKEYDITRAYAPYVISGLQRLGHEVINVTPPEAYRTLGNSLSYGISLANNNGADYFVSCHANDVDTVSAHGCEVIYGSERGSVLARNIVEELNNLGFASHRGAYLDERGLAEIHSTDMPAVIIEPLFISNENDVALYEKIGPEKIGYAIVKGLTGKDVISTNTEPTVKSNESIRALQHDLNIDYNAKIKETGIADADTKAALKGIEPIICKGHRSSVILWMQQKLVGWGYMKKIQSPGVYDEPTFQAVTNLQHNWERPTSGIMTQETWKIFLEN